MNVLIVGGTGVLSSAVVTEALKRGFSVTMINRGNRPIPSRVCHIKSSKDDYLCIKEALGDRHYSCVIDFLCFTDEETTDSIKFYSAYTDQYFFISSCAVYDKTLPGLKNEESSKPLSIWSYSVNKYKSENHLKQIAREQNCNYTIVRPCVTYGNTRIPYGIMPSYGYHWTLCARIIAGKPVIRWNGGINKSNMMRVEDFAVGLVGLIGNSKAYNEEFNICGDEIPSFNDVLDAVSSKLGKPFLAIDVSSEFYADEIPDRKGEILGGRSMDAINSNDKIKRLVPEFRHTIFLKDGISKTIDAYRNMNYQYGIDWQFDADTDRIIKKWCKVKGVNWKQYNLGFVDYLGNATFKDKVNYWKTLHQDSFFVKAAKRIKSVVSTILK